MQIKTSIIICLSLVTLISCNNATEKAGESATADAIYSGGDIITMETDSAVYAEAIAVKDGKIIFVGSKADAEKMKGDSTVMNDLQGKTLLPGFVDPHSHFIYSLAMVSQANCSSPPVGTAKDVDGIVASLKEFKEKHKLAPGELLIGYGYDDNEMPNGRLLNRDDLDKAFPDNPTFVIHVSGHGCVLNSVGLKKYGYSAKTVTPPGGVIVRKPGTKEPYGLIMEKAYLPVYLNLPQPTPEQQLELLKGGQMMYAEAGITTAQEGSTHTPEMKILQNGAKNNAFFIDVISYPFILDIYDILKDHPFSEFGTYHNRLKIGGAKITEDGSPQGRTAFFTTPYLTGGPGGEKNWKGEANFPQDSLNKWVKWFYDNNIQVNIHANGDATIDMLLKAHELASGDKKSADRRTTVIHSQFVRKDQLVKYKEYNIIPSMFAEHVFFFGDSHIKNRGFEQASFMSPLNTAIKMGIPATNHTDFNVLPIDQMMVLWAAVNRLTRTGVLLGADERITPYQALQCITIKSAYQYFEENSKGSLKSGKLADLVILDHNPLKIEPMKLKDIKVSETIKEGKTIYKR